MKVGWWILVSSPFSFFSIERIAASYQHTLMTGFLAESLFLDGKDGQEQQACLMIPIHFHPHSGKACKLFAKVKPQKIQLRYFLFFFF
jgi:hypothetical protein